MGDVILDPSPNAEARRSALTGLAAAEPALLAQLFGKLQVTEGWQAVRGPETGLVMVRGRTGGGGAPFNLGEVTISRATIKLTGGEVGHGYCLGRDTDKALTIAVLDALWQRAPEQIESAVLAPVRSALAARDEKRRQETAATKVDFFTMVRGED